MKPKDKRVEDSSEVSYLIVKTMRQGLNTSQTLFSPSLLAQRLLPYVAQQQDHALPVRCKEKPWDLWFTSQIQFWHISLPMPLSPFLQKIVPMKIFCPISWLLNFLALSTPKICFLLDLTLSSTSLFWCTAWAYFLSFFSLIVKKSHYFPPVPYSQRMTRRAHWTFTLVVPSAWVLSSRHVHGWFFLSLNITF